MKIALLGYGKMGKVIEKIALERGHEIVLKVGSSTTDFDITKADIAIEFSIPSKAVENIQLCLNNQVPVVSGTTGWLEHYEAMKDLCHQKKGAFIYASNFSLGVNLFFELNTQLAKMMRKFKQYDACLEEIHHTQKLDAPSGTAITLAEQIIQNSDKTSWALNPKNKEALRITAKRIGNVPGTHSVFYTSENDEIEIKHTAFNREGFAFGALIAAEWLLHKKGVFTMKDVLNLS
ncbi:MAG: 4-hydroxy-tetrahydrodipicolinate reductase [Flavobacteriaceae bacterium]|jgi:4-hydroxy-tetrahydrodipicolinate reductase|nr:4-hydroxy-tetrahydrodipicolinate reductase [Flavobacteriaceae bacterium]